MHLAINLQLVCMISSVIRHNSFIIRQNSFTILFKKIIHNHYSSSTKHLYSKHHKIRSMSTSNRTSNLPLESSLTASVVETDIPNIPDNIDKKILYESILMNETAISELRINTKFIVSPVLNSAQFKLFLRDLVVRKLGSDKEFRDNIRVRYGNILIHTVHTHINIHTYIHTCLHTQIV